MADAMASIEQQVALTLDAIFNRVGGLLEDQKQWAKETQHDALLLAATIMRKIAPELTRGTELPQIEHVINQAFGFLTEQPKVMIRVSAEFEEPLKDKVHLMASASDTRDRWFWSVTRNWPPRTAVFLGLPVLWNVPSTKSGIRSTKWLSAR